MENGFSVIMPTYNQASFIRRAILSLQKQTFCQWELIIINDGCSDETEFFISDFLSNPKVTYIKNNHNQGLGYAINQGLNVAKYKYIAYLPSDDFYYVTHLQELKEKFEENADVSLVYSGMRYDLNDTVANPEKYQTSGLREGYSLQLVQTAHVYTKERWIERNEFVTENLFLMFWHKLLDKGVIMSTNKISCYWTNHPHQRHKIIYEKYGGSVNYYRSFYKVQEPIKIRISEFKFIDEGEIYKKFRKKIVPAKNSLKILLIGELAFNPDRVYAFEEAGHQLYGLWMGKPTYCSTTIGHLPFGNVIDIPYEDYQNKVREIKPDIIYGLLNWGAIPLAYEVLKNCPEIPFVWHFKESHSHAMREGLWKELLYLHTHADGKIFINKEIKAWYGQFIPDIGLSHILDGDLPKKEYFNDCFTKRLSESDNEIHTVVPGRIVGISSDDVFTLSQNNIHIHVYTENYHYFRLNYLHHLKKIAPDHVHIHPHCIPEDWVREFSRYDVGWLHCFDSDNYGEILNASWDDMNIPARMPTLAAAGLPMIQKDNSNHTVSMQNIAKQKDVGVFFKDIEDLCSQLKDRKMMNVLRENLIKRRHEFSFDYHVPNLISFFGEVIRSHKSKNKYNG
jgi:glycosyltransferase involved in cell wall biosynthesis